jgi:hypothetical protein
MRKVELVLHPSDIRDSTAKAFAVGRFLVSGLVLGLFLNVGAYWVTRFEVGKAIPQGNILLVERSGELPHVKVDVAYVSDHIFRVHLVLQLAGSAVGACLAYCAYVLSNIRKTVPESERAVIGRLKEVSDDIGRNIGVANAIIADKEKKYLFVFDRDRAVFYDPEVYAEPGGVVDRACDVLIADAAGIHNLCLEPSYLQYLFARHGAQECTKILVVDAMSQGIVLYSTLAHLAKYHIYVLALSLFEQLLSTESPRVRDILNANPYVLKKSGGECRGRFSPGRSPHANPQKLEAQLCDEVWAAVEKIKAESHLVADIRNFEAEGARALASQRERARPPFTP